MSAKRIKTFNVLLKELNTKTKTDFKPAKTQLDLFNFQERFSKNDLIQKNSPDYLTFISYMSYIQKMYACTIKNTKERNEFLLDCENFVETEPVISSGLNSLISEMTPLIKESEIQDLFSPKDLANPTLLMAKLMDPNNSQMKILTEKFKPIIQNRINSGELDPSKITEEISKLF